MRLLYEDPWVLVCEKPAGLLSQRDAAGGESMISLLEAAYGPVWPVHRLDRETGGAMVVARTAPAAAALSEAVRQGRLTKEYLAVLPAAPALSEGVLEDLLFHDRTRNRSYPVDRLRKGAKQAKLAYRVLETQPSGCLVRVRLYTGRTHQIRVQFAARKLPLLGDRKYGSRETTCGMALWAARLEFPHPKDGKKLRFCSLPGAQTPPWDRFSPAQFQPEWDTDEA